MQVILDISPQAVCWLSKLSGVPPHKGFGSMSYTLEAIIRDEYKRLLPSEFEAELKALTDSNVGSSDDK